MQSKRTIRNLATEQVNLCFNYFLFLYLLINENNTSNFAGCHSINSTLFQGFAIGPDNHETSRRLIENTVNLLQELHRPGRVFYNKEKKKYFAFKLSITVDKKEANQATVTGGGSYFTNFFDVYTDDNKENKGSLVWRMCELCYEKGNILHFNHILY